MENGKKMSKKAKIIIAVLVFAIIASATGYIVYSYINGNLFNPDNISATADARKNDINFDKEINKVDENSQKESEKVNKSSDQKQNDNKNGNNAKQNNPKSKGKIFISSSTRNAGLAYSNTGTNQIQSVVNGTASNDIVYVNANNNANTQNNTGNTNQANNTDNNSGNNSSNNKPNNDSNNNSNNNSGNNNNNDKNDDDNNNNKPSDDNNPSDDQNDNEEEPTVVKPDVPTESVPEKSEPLDAFDQFDMSLPSYDPSNSDNASKNLKLSIQVVLPDDFFSTENKIYNGEKLNDTTLLNQVRAYAGPADEDGNIDSWSSYRLRSYNDNFLVKDYPQYAYNGFTATFCFRATSISPWQEQTVTFETVNRMLVVLTYKDGVYANNSNGNDLMYPGDGETVNLLKFYSSVCDPDENGDLKMLFRGWSNTKDGEPLDYSCKFEQEGLIFLYPTGYVELNDNYKEKLISCYDDGSLSFEFLQTLYDYTGDSKTLRIPEYTFNLQFENKRTFDKVIFPSTLKKISLIDNNGNNSLIVNEEYVVSKDNKYYSTLNGMLTSKEQDKIYDIPKNMTKITLDDNIKSIIFRKDSKLEELHLSSVVPDMNIENLSNAKIYVPKDAYYDYLKQYGPRLGTNELLREDSENENEYIYVDGAIYSSDSTVLYSISSDVMGTFIVPSCVKMIAENAMDNCPDVDTLIFKGDIDLFDDNSINAEHLKRIYFLGSKKLPRLYQNAIYGVNEDGATSIYVQSELYNGFNSLLNENLGDSFSDNYELKSDSLEIKYYNDYKYLATNEGAILLKAATLGGEFKEDTLGDINLVEIGANAFANNENIRFITLPESVKTIGKCAFKSCANLESIYVTADDIITVEKQAFYENTALKFCAFNAEVGLFDEDYTEDKNTGMFFAPYNAYGYDSQHLAHLISYFTPFGHPYIVKDYGDGKVLFAYAEKGDVNPYTDGYIVCKATSEVSGDIELIDNTISVEYKAFYKCAKPFKLINYSKIDVIGEMAFAGSGIYGSYNFESLYFARGSAFENCQGLTELEFGSNFYNAYYNIFGNCRNLKRVKFDTDNPFSLTSSTYLTPYSFGDNIGADCGGFKIEVNDGADIDNFIDMWKYPMLGKDVFYDYGNLTEEEDIEGQNLVRKVFGMEALPYPKKPENQENVTENPDENNTNNNEDSQSSSNALDNKTEQENEADKIDDENYITVDISELQNLATITE